MWDILRFLKNPDGELNRDDAARTDAEALKRSVDSRLIESLANSRPENDQEGVSHNENAFLTEEAESLKIRAHTSSNTASGDTNARPAGKTAPRAAPIAAVPPKADETPAEPKKRPAPEKTPEWTGERLLKLPLSDIKPNPYQPRKVMGENEIVELSESIRELGVLQPIIVKQAEFGYELVAGERRLRAAQRAGLSEIPAVLIETEPLTQQIIALVENIQRKNLSAIEEAVCLRDIQEKTGWSQTEISRRMGRSQASVANKLRLLRLDPSVQELVISGKLGERQARSLLSLSADEQKLLAQKTIDEDLSARTLETLVENWGDHQPRAKRAEKKKQSSSDGPAGELLGDLAALVTRHRNNGISAQWRVKQMNQSSLVVEISVDLTEGAAVAAEMAAD
jgi:ParB family chromosome partitioning protein